MRHLILLSFLLATLANVILALPLFANHLVIRSSSAGPSKEPSAQQLLDQIFKLSRVHASVSYATPTAAYDALLRKFARHPDALAVLAQAKNTASETRKVELSHLERLVGASKDGI